MRQKAWIESLETYDVAILGAVGSPASEFDEASELLRVLALQALTGQVIPSEPDKEVLVRCKVGLHLRALLEFDP